MLRRPVIPVDKLSTRLITVYPYDAEFSVARIAKRVCKETWISLSVGCEYTLLETCPEVKTNYLSIISAFTWNVLDIELGHRDPILGWVSVLSYLKIKDRKGFAIKLCEQVVEPILDSMGKRGTKWRRAIT